jgi:hypothetical protein
VQDQHDAQALYRFFDRAFRVTRKRLDAMVIANSPMTAAQNDLRSVTRNVPAHREGKSF